ncbi:MAG TPA: ABC transporter permease [Gemmatimonadaceae bacterium]|nr:ABC transporter permease [Gemmatimonadaceae bacterium]
MKRIFRLPLSRDRVHRDIDAELTFHLEGRVEELVAGGMSRKNAEREALARFGDRAKVEAEVERIDAATFQRQRLRQRLAALYRDAQYARRGLTRRPLYSIAVVLTLALGIGANTAIFSMVEAVLLRPYNIAAIGRLVAVRDDFPLMNMRNTAVSPLEALVLMARRDLFDAGMAFGGENLSVEIAGEPARIQGFKTLGEFFTVLGAKPLYGRLYRPEDSEVGRARVVVLSHRLWQQLSGDTAIVGRTILMNGEPNQVIGIMPPDFGFPRVALFWRPFVLDQSYLKVDARGTLVTAFVGRMHAGMTLDRLGVELRALAAQWHRAYPASYSKGGHTMLVKSFVEWQAGQQKPIVLALFAAVVFVLLIACANVASLQLVRSAGRAREFAVRAALGAGRAAIARQIIVETMLLAIAGGVAGVLLGRGALRWLSHLNVAQFSVLKDLRLDGTVLAFTTGTVLLAGLIVGSAPAWGAARANVNRVLHESGRGASAGPSRHRFLRASVVLQNALTLLLLVGAALTIRSLDRLLQSDPGFQAEHVVNFGITLPAQRYAGKDARLAFFDALDGRLRAIPGVQSVGFALGVPFSGDGGSTLYTLAGVPPQPGEPERHANQAFVYGDYFKAMGIQIVRGRPFTAEDYSGGTPTVVVDETLVRQSFGSRDPIGVRIEHGPEGTIVGVARLVKQGDLGEPPHPLVYHDYGHAAGYIGSLTAVIRSTLPADRAIKAARAAVAALDPKLALYSPRALADRMNDTLGARRLGTDVLAGFAVLSLVLALLGVYAVMSYVVSERTREIGIRVALGAQRAQIAAMVMRDGVVLAAVGLAIGAVAFLGLGRLMGSLLYGVGVLDPVALVTAVALLGGVTVIACYLPARRAVRVDPVQALRAE